MRKRYDAALRARWLWKQLKGRRAWLNCPARLGFIPIRSADGKGRFLNFFRSYLPTEGGRKTSKRRSLYRSFTSRLAIES